MMRFGIGLMRFVSIASRAIAIGVLMSASASAQQAPQLPVDEDARLALIDHCVLNEGARFGQYVDFASRCKCATNSMMKVMSEQDMQAVAKWRKPTTALKGKWEAAWNACQ